MSQQELERFNADIRDDTALQDAFQGIGNDVDTFVSKANEAGYDFSVEEVKAAIAEREAQLSDEELEVVSGGTARAEVFGIIDAVFDFVI